jgi:hypothetical protein
MSTKNYSFETSKPAYQENKANSKERQCEKVLNAVRFGANNLLQISEATGILQAIVSARCNDLINEGKIQYLDFVTYKDRKRKKIQLTKPKKFIQSELF